MSYDLATDAFTSHGVAPNSEGVITMAMDAGRGRMYELTWPTGHFVSAWVADEPSRTSVRDHGPWSRGGEAVRGSECVWVVNQWA